MRLTNAMRDVLVKIGSGRNLLRAQLPGFPADYYLFNPRERIFTQTGDGLIRRGLIVLGASDSCGYQEAALTEAGKAELAALAASL